VDWFAFWGRRGYLNVNRRETLGCLISISKDDEEKWNNYEKKENLVEPTKGKIHPHIKNILNAPIVQNPKPVIPSHPSKPS
jgi:hypothetical protein